MAFRRNIFILNFFAFVFAWIDTIESIVQFSICDGFYIDSGDEISELIQTRYFYFLVQKILSSIPFAFFTSFMITCFTYRMVYTFLDYTFQWRRNLIEKRKNFFIQLFDIHDKDEIIYSKSDLDYVIQLLNNKPINQK